MLPALANNVETSSLYSEISSEANDTSPPTNTLPPMSPHAEQLREVGGLFPLAKEVKWQKAEHHCMICILMSRWLTAVFT